MSDKKNVIMDASILSSLMSCARLTDLRYNHNFIPLGGKSNSLEVGSLVHKVLETFYKETSRGMKRDEAIARAIIAGEMYVQGCPKCTAFIHISDEKPECGHEPNEYPGMQNTPAENEKYTIGWKWALQTCEQYFEHYRNDSWIPLEVEHVKTVLLYEDDEIRVGWKAKLDLTVDTNSGIFPMDHKTMKQRRESLDLNNQFIGQCLVMNTRQMWINKIGFQTTLKPHEKFERVPMSYTADRLLEWQSEILPYYAYQMIAYHEAAHYPPNFTHCENKYGFCSFKDVCKADRGMREEELKINFMVGPEWNPTNNDE